MISLKIDIIVYKSALLKGTVNVILRVPPCKDCNSLLTTIPLIFLIISKYFPAVEMRESLL